MIGDEVEERNRIIGQNLRKYRLLKGMTQDDLAEGLCSVSQLSKVENGKTYVKRTILKQMAERLGVTVEKVESTDPVLEELNEMYRVAKDAHAANRYEIAFDLVRELKEKCHTFEYPELLWKSTHLECWLLNKTGRHEKVIEIMEQTTNDELLANDTHKTLLVYELGVAYHNTGNVKAALECYKRVEETFQWADLEEDSRMHIMFNLMKCNLNLKNYRSALRYAEKTMELAKSLDLHLYRLRAAYLMAHILGQLGRSEEADELYVKALREAENNSFMLDVAIISNNYGEFLFNRGNYAQARTYFRRAKTTCELLDNYTYIFESHIYLSDLETLEGNIPAAIEYLDSIFTIAEKKEMNAFKEKAKALIRLARIHNLQGDFEEYVKLMDQGFSLFEQQEELDEAFHTAVELADAFYEKEDPRAIVFYRKAVECSKQLHEVRG